MSEVQQDAGAGRQMPTDADPEPPRTMVLDVVVEDALWEEGGALAPVLERAAQAVALRLGYREGEAAAVALACDARVRALNRAYRGQDKPTNVLSFRAPAPRGERGPERFLGDIILARETVAREAAEQGKPLRQHLQHLLVHGLLHLAGYDHERPDEAAEMERLEVDILAQIGVPDPYAEMA